MKRLAAVLFAVFVIAVTSASAPAPHAQTETPGSMSSREIVDALSHLATETATLHADIAGMALDHQRESAAVAAGLSDVANAMRDLSRSITERETGQAERERNRWPR